MSFFRHGNNNISRPSSFKGRPGILPLTKLFLSGCAPAEPGSASPGRIKLRKINKSRFTNLSNDLWATKRLLPLAAHLSLFSIGYDCRFFKII